MSYVNENLMPNEKVSFSARVHPAIFLPAVIAFIASLVFVAWAFSTTPGEDAAGVLITFLLLVSAMFFVISMLLALQALITLYTTEVAVTNRRVIAKVGLIRRHTLEILLPRIESVAVMQNSLGRLLGFGTVTVTGTGGTRGSFRGIAAPLALRMKINEIVENSA
jgi:uncharacterized membrane protein YdbT with pleckstrin-like domain